MLAVVAYVLGFIFIVVVLLVVHEAGHFAMAKAAKVKVLEFGVGFPPRIWGIRRGETLYSMNAIPLGAFVKMVGEEDPSDPRSLAGKSTGVRLLVMAAGPFMNVVLALLLFSLLFMIPQQVAVTIMEVETASPAEQAGLLPGDVIIELDGDLLSDHTELSDRINLKQGAHTSWLVQRGDQRFLVDLVPRLNPPEGQGAAGISVTTYGNRAQPPWTAVGSGLRLMGDILIQIKTGIAQWIAGGAVPFAGPIGVGHLAKDVSQVEGLDLKMATLYLAAFISFILAVFNILPIPPLDGGRILFLAIEFVRRGKRISPEKEGAVHLVGFVILITLGLIVAFLDVQRITRGESLLGG